MNLKVKPTNQAILRSGEDIKGGSCEIAFRPSGLARRVRILLADRLHEDIFVCTGRVNEDGRVEPGLPDPLCLDGTEVKHLAEALRRDDEEEVQACRANMAVAVVEK